MRYLLALFLYGIVLLIVPRLGGYRFLAARTGTAAHRGADRRQPAGRAVA